MTTHINTPRIFLVLINQLRTESFQITFNLTDIENKALQLQITTTKIPNLFTKARLQMMRHLILSEKMLLFDVCVLAVNY